MPERWAFAILVVGSITYTVADIARRLGRPRPRLAANTRSSRPPHARPFTSKEHSALRRRA